MLRQIGGVLAGMIVGAIVIALIQGVGHVVIPPPPGTELKDMEQIKAYVATAPLGVFLFLCFIYDIFRAIIDWFL